MHLYFEIGKSNITRNQRSLDSLIKVLDENSRISIYGFTDFIGSSEQNRLLSEQRANAVKEYFLKNNSKLNIASCSGNGEINFNGVPDKNLGHPPDRRVDVIISRLEKNEHVLPPIKEAVKKPIQKKLNELKVGESIEIEGLTFIPGRHFLMRGSIESMKKLYKELKSNKALKIEIQGHICCPEVNSEDGYDFDTREYKLSVNRAKYVYNYLVKRGISKSRLTYKGFGNSVPKVSPEKNEDDRQQNRRVEILILEN